MARLGYVRNRAAKGAKPQPAGSIALVVCEDGSRIFSDPFSPRIIWGVGRVLAPGDLQLVLLMVRSADDQPAAARYLRSGHVDGALFVSMHGPHSFDLEDLGLPRRLPLGGGRGRDSRPGPGGARRLQPDVRAACAGPVW